MRMAKPFEAAELLAYPGDLPGNTLVYPRVVGGGPTPRRQKKIL